MRRPVRLRPASPALIVAGLALLVATAGVGTAATAYITGKQVEDGSLTGKDVRNHSLGPKELSPTAYAALRGATGPLGPTGSTGPSAALAAIRGNASPPSLPANATTTIATRGNLTAGRWLVIARVWFDDVSGSPKNVTCRLEVGTSSDETNVGVPGVDSGGAATCMLVLPVEITATLPAVLKLLTPAGSAVRAGSSKIVAVQVGTLDINTVTG